VPRRALPSGESLVDAPLRRNMQLHLKKCLPELATWLIIDGIRDTCEHYSRIT
jgi:hypothetical protein